MFEDIKKMLPARVKATTGLLIEPHILERSKIAQKDPTGEEYQKETTIHYGDTTILSAENSQYESVVDANLSENLTGENNQYESVIDANLSENLIADSYQYNSLINDNLLPTTMAENYQQNVTIDARLDLPTILTEVDLQIDTFGQTEYETIGFGIYAEDGHAIRTYFDKNGRRVKERIKVNLVKEEKTRKINVWNVITPDRKGDPRGGMRAELETYYETKLYIQPYSGSTTITAGKNNIVQVTAVDGYLPTHYRNTSDLTTGLQNSFFRGSKNTAATTLDGSSPVETFISNPTTLTVNKTGRNTAEPILEVE
jgi:predicted small secreted protein